MHICSKCGAEYNSNFLQCPQCGHTKYEEALPETSGNKLVGAIISLIIIGGLIGLISYGVYVVYHPYVEDSAMSDIDWSTISTEPTTSIRATTSSDINNNSSNNGTKYAYQGHELLIPSGYDFTAKLDGDSSYKLSDSENSVCIGSMSDMYEQYCFALLAGNFSLNSIADATINQRVDMNKYDNMKTIRLSKGSYYYALSKTQSIDGYISGLIIGNKGDNHIYNEFTIKGSELNKENGTIIDYIVNNYK